MWDGLTIYKGYTDMSTGGNKVVIKLLKQHILWNTKQIHLID